MRYVNNQLEVSIRQYRGAFPPRSTELTLVEPEFLHSPDPYLFYDEDAPIRVDPWFSVFETDAPQGSSSLAVFDGVKTRKPNRTDTDDVLVYTDPMTGERGKRRTDRRTTWGEWSAWFASGASWAAQVRADTDWIDAHVVGGLPAVVARGASLKADAICSRRRLTAVTSTPCQLWPCCNSLGERSTHDSWIKNVIHETGGSRGPWGGRGSATLNPGVGASLRI